MEISAALERAGEYLDDARRELDGIEIGETMMGGPMLQLDIGHALVEIDHVRGALERAVRHAAMVEA